jgi:hypothetical protein
MDNIFIERLTGQQCTPDAPALAGSSPAPFVLSSDHGDPAADKPCPPATSGVNQGRNRFMVLGRYVFMGRVVPTRPLGSSLMIGITTSELANAVLTFADSL